MFAPTATPPAASALPAQGTDTPQAEEQGLLALWQGMVSEPQASPAAPVAERPATLAKAKLPAAAPASQPDAVAQVPARQQGNLQSLATETEKPLIASDKAQQATLPTNTEGPSPRPNTSAPPPLAGRLPLPSEGSPEATPAQPQKPARKVAAHPLPTPREPQRTLQGQTEAELAHSSVNRETGKPQQTLPPPSGLASPQPGTQVHTAAPSDDTLTATAKAASGSPSHLGTSEMAEPSPRSTNLTITPPAPAEAPAPSGPPPTAVAQTGEAAPSAPGSAVHSKDASTPTPSPQPAEQVREAIQARGASTRIEVQLDPPELGRVQIEFELRGTGQVRALVSASEGETMDLLRRQAADLLDDLKDGGFDDVDLAWADHQSSEDPAGAQRPLRSEILRPAIDNIQSAPAHPDAGLLNIRL